MTGPVAAAAPWAVGALLALAVLAATRPARLPVPAPGRHPAAGTRGHRVARGHRHSSARTRRRPGTHPGAAAHRADPPLAMDLLAAALLSGAAVPTALAVVAEALSGEDGERLGEVAELLGMGTAPQQAWAGAGERWSPMARCLELAALSGAPTAALLRRAARSERSDRAQRRAAAAQRLGVWVLLPMGTCALPGFAALGVVPLVLSLAGSLAGV